MTEVVLIGVDDLAARVEEVVVSNEEEFVQCWFTEAVAMPHS
jgi:hypothetical protein